MLKYAFESSSPFDILEIRSIPIHVSKRNPPEIWPGVPQYHQNKTNPSVHALQNDGASS